MKIESVTPFPLFAQKEVLEKQVNQQGTYIIKNKTTTGLEKRLS